MRQPAVGIPTSQQVRDLDLVYLARQTAGDRDLEREVLGLFRDQCVRLLRIMLQNGAEQSRLDAAHTLKGAARGIGAFRIADVAETIETADKAKLATHLAELERAIDDARRMIDRLIAAE